MFALTAEEQDRLVNIAICPICFSSGKGVGFHLPNHSYEIVVRVCYLIHCIKDLQKWGGVNKCRVDLTGRFPMSFFICDPNFKSLWPPCQKLWLDEFEGLWASRVVLLCKDDVSTSAKEIWPIYIYIAHEPSNSSSDNFWQGGPRDFKFGPQI